MTLRTKIIFTLALLSLTSGVALASIGDSSIKTWNSPLPSGIYGYTDHVVYSGTVEIPEDWMGQVRFYRDGAQLPGLDQPFFNFNTATTTFPFSVDSGAWTAGAHQVEVRFDGAAECRLVCADNDLTCQNNVNTDGDATNDWCPRNINNQVLDQWYPMRNISIGPPPQPELTLSANPIHFWSHVKGSPVVTQSIILTNTGAVGSLVSGNTTRISGTMFVCQSGCNYSISPGQSHTMTVAFTPPSTANTWYGVFQLSCAGCVSSSVTLNVDGETTDVLTPAEITPSRGSIDYNVVNLGQSRSEDLWIENTGGTPMTGTITFNDPQISCDGTCDFTLNAGQSDMRRIVYAPTVAITLSSVTATVSANGGASPVVIPITGEGNDKPMMDVWSSYTWDDVNDNDTITVTNINAGESGAVYFYTTNGGAGLLDGKVDSIALGDGSFVCSYGCDTASYDNIQNYSLTSDARELRLDLNAPADGSVRTVTLTFRDITPGGTKIVHVTVSIEPNTQPIGATNGCTLNFGNVLVGESSLPRTEFFTNQSECEIKNIGVGSLDVSLPNFTRNGTGKYDCVVAGPEYQCGSFSLSHNEVAKFTYRFTALLPEPDTDMHNWYPAAEVPFEGFTNPWEVHFHAQSVALDLDVTPQASPSYDFGKVNIGETSPTKDYLVSAIHIGGDDDWYFSEPLQGEVHYSIQNSAHFTCTQNCSGTLVVADAGPQTAMASIVFTPGVDVGTISEDVLVNYDFGSTWSAGGVPGPKTLSLTGVGNDGPILEFSGDVTISTSPTGNYVYFNAVGLNTTKELLVKIKNIGLGMLTGSFPAMPAPYACIAPTCDPFSLTAGNSVTARLTFTPPLANTYNKSIILTTPNSDKLKLRGSGQSQPQLTLSTTFIDFDALTNPASQTDVGDVRPATFRITNSGLGTMSGTVYLTDPSSHFLLTSQTFSIIGGDYIDVPVSFAPLLDGVVLSAGVSVDADDGLPGGWTDHQSLGLSGTGSFAAVFDPRGINSSFGPVIFGKNKELTTNLRNNGVRPLGQGTLEFPVGSPFTCVSPIGPSGKCEYDIGAGGEQAIVIRFTPAGLGQVTGSMSLSSIPGFTIRFTGNGIPPRFNYKEQ